MTIPTSITVEQWLDNTLKKVKLIIDIRQDLISGNLSEWNYFIYDLDNHHIAYSGTKLFIPLCRRLGFTGVIDNSEVKELIESAIKRRLGISVK